jgi:hypothetical protein
MAWRAETPAGVKVRPPETAGCRERNAEAQVGSRVATMIKVRAENSTITMSQSERMELLKVTDKHVLIQKSSNGSRESSNSCYFMSTGLLKGAFNATWGDPMSLPVW